jgi:acetyl esterase/lipase
MKRQSSTPRFHTLLFVLVCAAIPRIIVAAAELPAAQPAAKFEPPAGRVLHGMGQWDAYNAKLLQSLPAAVRPAAQLLFIDIGDTPRGWRPQGFAARLEVLGREGLVPVLDIGLRGNRPTKAELDRRTDKLFGIDHEVAAGTRFDERIRDLAKVLREFGKPALVRIGGEFSGWWSGYHPYAYPQAFRKIVGIFRMAGVTNVAFVWCYEPAAPGDFDEQNAQGEWKWYPGDDVVDWFSIDWFNTHDFVGPLTDAHALTPNGRSRKFLDMAVAHRKPVVIAESSPCQYDLTDPDQADAAWREWFQPYFRTIAERSEIKWFHLVSFDWPRSRSSAENGWKNNDFAASPVILQKLVAELKKPRYLHAGDMRLLGNNAAMHDAALKPSAEPARLANPAPAGAGADQSYRSAGPVAYGEHPSQVLYVNYYPQGPARPTMIQFNSGGWNSNPLKEQPSIPLLYEKLGLAHVVICHRSLNAAEHPAQVNDAVAGTRYVKEHAAQWNLDPNRIAITGRSSGGHLAMWVGFHPHSPKIAAVVTRSGPADFSPEFIASINPEMLSLNVFDKLFGAAAKDRHSDAFQKKLREFSPVTYMSADDPPTLFLANRQEPQPSGKPVDRGYGVHHPRLTERGYERLKEVGGVAEFHLSEAGRGRDGKAEEIEEAFLRKYLLREQGMTPKTDAAVDAPTRPVEPASPQTGPTGKPASSARVDRVVELAKFEQPRDHLPRSGAGGTEWDACYRSFIQTDESAASKGFPTHAEAARKIKADAAGSAEALRKHKGWILHIKHFSQAYRPDSATADLKRLYEDLVTMELGGEVRKEMLPFDNDPRLTIQRDVVYGKTAPEVQRLDAYLVKSEHAAPVLIEFHGGGWRRGGKSQFTYSEGLIESIVADGISVISVDYRLTPKHPLPAQVEDAARAVQFVRSKAKQWNLDPQRIVAMGGSAGAHLAAWVALHDDLAQPNSPDPVAHRSTRLQGFVDLWGPMDLTRVRPAELAKAGLRGADFADAFTAAFGCSADAYERDPEIRRRVREASPLFLVTRDDPAALIIHTAGQEMSPGTHPPVPDIINDPHAAWHGVLLAEALREAGVPVVCRIGPQVGKDTTADNKAIIGFLRERFRPPNGRP